MINGRVLTQKMRFTMLSLIKVTSNSHVSKQITPLAVFGLLLVFAIALFACKHVDEKAREAHVSVADEVDFTGPYAILQSSNPVELTRQVNVLAKLGFEITAMETSRREYGKGFRLNLR